MQILSQGWMIKMLIFELCYSAFIDGCAVTFGVSQSSGAAHPNIVRVPTAFSSKSGRTGKPGADRMVRRAFPNVCFASIARPVACQNWPGSMRFLVPGNSMMRTGMTILSPGATCVPQLLANVYCSVLIIPPASCHQNLHQHKIEPFVLLFLQNGIFIPQKLLKLQPN